MKQSIQLPVIASIMIHSIKLPIKVIRKRKTMKDKNVYINLNTYRNWHFTVSNMIKKQFGDLIRGEVEKLPEFKSVRLIYKLYKKTKVRCDLVNSTCIVDKFFQDVLVECNKIPDDSVNYVSSVTFTFGGYIKEESHIICDIYPLTTTYDE